MIKTVTLSGTEVAVDGLDGFHTVVHNMSDGAVYASRHPNITAGADNVAEIPAGAAKLISTTKGKVYLVGNGRVELTGQDDEGIDYSSSAVSAGIVGGSGVTEQFVTERDALNLEAAKAYTDSVLEEAKNCLEQEIADKSVVSDEGAFDLRYNDDKLQAKIGDNWSDITTGGGEGGVSQAYVDSHDADAITAANEYTDTVADKKADKPINAFVLIETVSWESDSEEYPYYYNIPIEGASSADRADVRFSDDSQEAAKKCEFSTEVTVTDGIVKIRAKHIPETVLSANVQIGVLSANNTLHVGTKSGPVIDDETVEAHNVDPTAHTDIRASLRELEEQVDDKIDNSIEEHNADDYAHPDIRDYLNELKGRVIALESAAGGDITANAFAVTFGDLDGVIANGVWVPASARLEF